MMTKSHRTDQLEGDDLLHIYWTNRLCSSEVWRSPCETSGSQETSNGPSASAASLLPKIYIQTRGYCEVIWCPLKLVDAYHATLRVCRLDFLNWRFWPWITWSLSSPLHASRTRSFRISRPRTCVHPSMYFTCSDHTIGFIADTLMCSMHSFNIFTRTAWWRRCW